MHLFEFVHKLSHVLVSLVEQLILSCFVGILLEGEIERNRDRERKRKERDKET